MSRNPSRSQQQHSRIKDLFTDLDLESKAAVAPDNPSLLDSAPPLPAPEAVPAPYHRPTSVIHSPEDTIGFMAESKNGGEQPDPDLYVTMASEAMTLTGERSLAQNQVLVVDTQGDEPAVLAIPASFGDGKANLLLELLDDQSQRAWSEDEKLLVEQVTDQLALALENAQLISQTQQALNETEARARELSILNEMSRAFASSLEVGPVIDIIYTYTSQLMDTSNFYLALYQPEEESLSFYRVTAKGVLIEQDHPDWDYWCQSQPLSGLIEYVIKEQKPLLLEPNMLAVPEVERLVSLEFGPGGVKSWLGIPMTIGDQVIGAIRLQNETLPDVFNQRHLELLTTIGNQGAIAIQNARLLQETRKRNRDLATINTIISSASRTLDLTTMLEAVLSQVLASAGFQSGLVTIFNPTIKKLYLAAQSNLPEAISDQYATKGLDGTLSEQVFEQGEVINIEHLAEGCPGNAHEYIKLGFHSYLGVPLVSKGKILGTICLYSQNSQAIQTELISLMKLIGQQVGVAVDNARLFEQTQTALAETEILYNASARLNSAQSYHDILNALSIYSILGQADINLTIDLFDQPWSSQQPPHTIFVMSRKSNIKTDSLHRHYQLSSLPSFTTILHPERPTIVSDVESDPRLDDNLRGILLNDFHAQSTIFVPLVVSGQWIGYLNGIFGQKIDYRDRDLRRLSALSNLAAVAIQNIRLLEESRRRAEQLQTAADVARDTSSTLALDNLLNRAVDLIRDGFGYSQCTIFLVDEGGKRAMVRASTGIAGQEMKKSGHTLTVGSRSIIGYVMKTGQSYVVNNVFEDAYYLPNPLLPDTRSEIGLPLKISNRVIGALDVQANQVDAFTPDDVSVLQILADQIAVAVDNARAYELSIQAMEEMRQADKIKSQFLANMSHELRTPLNSIIGFSRVILKGIDGPITDIQQQDLTAIHNSGQHLLNLINDILDLSKIEAGKMELTLEENVNLADLINSVMSTVTGLVKDKPIRLKRNLAPDLPLMRVDPTKIRQVLINLLSNAAKFTDEGTITIEAQLQEKPNGDPEVLISVIDTGSGIALEDQNKLFQPFSQVDASPTRKTGGSGLGLSICRHMVEMHGGQIGLKSELGTGSTFYFTLPTHFGLKPIADVHTGALGPIVLSIDDEHQVIELYKRYLANHGYKVYPLTAPSRSVEVAKKLQPVAITLDIMMPDYSGWQVLQDLKSNPETQHIPIIICSILDDHGKGFNLGATDYLLKPILEEDLVNVLKKLDGHEGRQRVLVIDDNPEDRRLVQKSFENHNEYEIIFAENGEQALVELGSNKPNVVILDLFLPDINGFTLLETIREDPSLRDIPVIIYTAGDLQEEQLQILSESSQAMLKKDLLAENELFTSITQTLDRCSHQILK
jgi:signal transduction histidine kinase/DNA-binding response OmpR family regulator